VNFDVVVIGGGIFGQTIAAELRSQGRRVLVIDDWQPQAGSIPSACLMKPSWLESISTEVQDRAYETLDRHFGVHSLTFKVGPVKLDTVRWCDPRKILTGITLRGRATSVSDKRVHALVDGRPVILEPRAVVVAAGSWCNQLVKEMPPVQARMGAALLWRKRQIPANFISPWAPYRQLVAFNLGEDVWVGDGTAVKPESWSRIREVEIQRRCAGKVGFTHEDFSSYDFLIGRRPYMPKKVMEGKPCYLSSHEGVIVATGGAKNGTIAAGWAAHAIGVALG